MNGIPEGRDTTGQGRASGPDRNDQLRKVGSCVSSFSRHRQIGFARSLPVSHPLAKARERPLSAAHRNVEEGGERSEMEGGSEGKGRTPGRAAGTRQAVRFAVGADCCGALGCTESSGLLVVEQDGETRTLCPDHAARWSQ